MTDNTWEGDNLSSPPFPSSLTTPRGLSKKLLEAYAWVEDHLQFANDQAVEVGCPESPFVTLIPPGAVPLEDTSLLNVSVPSLFKSWMALRAVRERWDWIFRNYEDDWDNAKCKLHRMMCIKAAATVLNTAFLDPETLEAREEKEKEKERVHLLNTLKELNFPPSLLSALGVANDEDDDEIDYDKLFHGDSEDDE